MKTLLIAVSFVLTLVVSAAASASPYEVVAIYARDGARRELHLNDLMNRPDDNIVIPNAFSDDGAYHLVSIEERLDAEGIDRSYLKPFWNFSVYEVTDRSNFDKVDGVLLDAKHTTASWTLTDLLAGHSSASITTIRIKTRGSFAPEYLCGLETIYREKNGVDPALKPGDKSPDKEAKDAMDAVNHAPPDATPRKWIRIGKQHVVLYSFCDAFLSAAQRTESVDWSEALKKPVFQLGAASTPDELREAHRRALVSLLFGDEFNSNGLRMAEVVEAARGTNVVIEATQSFSILDLTELTIRERDNHKSTTPEESVGKVIDQNSTLEADFSSLAEQCAYAVSPPYSIVIMTTDQNKNPVTIKAPVNTATPCRPELNVKWSDYLGKEIRVQLLYQLPGLGGRVLVSESPPFTVRELGLITTFPIVSEVVSLATAANPKSLASTSSIPVSWAMRLSPYSAAYTAVTFPWKLSFNTRDAPELAKYIAIYPHVTIVIPASAGASPTYAVGAGVSLTQFFNFAYGLSPPTGSSFLLIGLSIQDIVKILN